MKKEWYVVNTVSGHEYKVKEKLEIFPKLELIKIDDVFGSWENAQKTHFNDGGTFDLIYK